MELIKPYLAAIIIILLSFNARAATVSVSPQSQTAIEGNNFTVSVMLEPEGSSVYGVQFDLIFNKTIVEALAVEKGTLLGSDGAVTIEGVKSIDNANGRVSYSISRSGTSTGISSSGAIAEITFRGVSAGTSTLNFADVVISDPNASEIPGSTQAGSVTVAAATITPTATAIPGLTQTSTPVSGTPPQQGNASQTASTIDKMELMYPNNTLVALSSESSVSEGDEFVAYVHIKSTEPVYGAELKLVFDADFLEGIKLEQGDFLGGSLVVNSLDNEKGELTYAETKVGNIEGVIAKGVLAKATFRAKKAGNTTIGLKDVRLVNENEAMVRDVLYDGKNLTISRSIESRKVGMIGAYWALVAFISLVLIIRRRSR